VNVYVSVSARTSMVPVDRTPVATKVGTGPQAAQIGPLNVGPHTIEVEATDGENLSPPRQIQVLVDTSDKCSSTPPDPACPDQIDVDPPSWVCAVGEEADFSIRNRVREREIDWKAVRGASWLELRAGDDDDTRCGRNECDGSATSTAAAVITVECNADGLALGSPTSYIEVSSPDTQGQTERIVIQLLAPTLTPTQTPTGTPTPTAPPTSTPTATPTPPRVGDCDRDGKVAINELVVMVNIALEAQLLRECPAGDANGSGAIEVTEIIKGVNEKLNSH
jgi:hypothetical protein